jgi:chaperonin GroES
MKIDLESAPYEMNLAEKLKEQELDAIGIDLKEQIELDESSRREWMDNNKTWLRLASQVRETKNTPWPGASNVKYPLLTVASMQFHARALPNLVNSSRPVQVRKIGRDKDQQKLDRANRIETYMSYQVLEGMDDWLDEMDRMLFVLPMLGICYKKTYFSESTGKIKSCLVLPNDLIVNYHARSFDRARMTHVLYMDTNEVYELQAD